MIFIASFLLRFVDPIFVIVVVKTFMCVTGIGTTWYNKHTVGPTRLFSEYCVVDAKDGSQI
jgi:hypothetical protein